MTLKMALEMILLIFLIVCAIISTVQKNLLSTVLIFMSYGVIMSVVWLFLESPDLAITEAAVGAGITTILFFVTLKKVDHLHFRKPKHPQDPEQLVKPPESVQEGEDDA